MKKVALSAKIARKVLETVDVGLCSGVGEPIPGKMCVEAAVCYALGQPHGDQPQCVGEAVRRFKIALNDSVWSSNEARAAGMRRVAVAQLGSDETDQLEFAKLLSIETVKKVLPLALRAVAAVVPSHKDALEAASLVCEAVKDLSAADSAANAAYNAARSAADSAADSAARSAAYSAARSAAYSAAYSAANAAYNAADSAASAAYSAANAADSAANAAYSAADSAAYSAADSAARSAADSARDAVLSAAAEVAVTALKKLKTEGTKWLGLCK